MSKTIDYQVDTDGIATLTMDLAGRPMNVLTSGFLAELADCIEKVATDDKVSGAIITSGKESFFAGADLKALVGEFDRQRSAQDVLAMVRPFSETLRALETSGKPFVAAINGTALGGGLEICLACHHRVAAANAKAVLGLPEVQVGLLPGAGGTQRLPRMIGVQPALELMTQGHHINVDKALALGIVDSVVPPGDLLAAAKHWLLDSPTAEQPWDKKGFKVPGGAGAMHPRSVQTFMVGSAMISEKTLHNYPAPIAIMSCVFEGTIVPMDTALRIESRYFTGLLIDPVSRNLIRTLFVNKGAADKLVRRPKDIAASEVKRLGMLGAGMMGAGIAFVSARAGIEVILLDTTIEAAEKGKDYSRMLMQKRIDRGKSTSEKSDALLALIRTTTDYADLEDVDLIVEAVFEQRDIKADVTEKSEVVMPRTSVFASNTSTLPITGLAEASVRPEKFIGLHFFSPVDKMPLVEVIMGKKTSDEALARSLDYVRQIRKTPIVVNDSRGFYTSRVFSTYTNEGMALLKDGVLPALIENAGKLAGMPVGPLAVFDEVTIELGVKVHKQSQADLGDAYKMPSAMDVAVKFVEELGRKGKRYGAGFYEYPEGGRKHLWTGLATHYPPAAEQPDVEGVKKRLLFVQAIETVCCLEEGVLTDVAEADIGSILGWGFPPYTGGTLSFIDTYGQKAFVAEADRLAAAYGERFAVPGRLREMAEAGERFHPYVDAENG